MCKSPLEYPQAQVSFVKLIFLFNWQNFVAEKLQRNYDFLIERNKID